MKKKTIEKIIIIKIIKIIISILLIYVVFGIVGLYYSLSLSKSYYLGARFNLSSQYTHPEVIEWVAESDNSGKGVFVLRLSWERQDQFFHASARPEDQEMPDDVFGAFIYINSFENDDIEQVFGRCEIKGSTLSVFYQIKGTQEDLEDANLYDNFYLSHEYRQYTNHINHFSGYELSSFSTIGAGVTNLEIFINGEKVEFHVSTLD